jgi:hypothetical protein
MCKAHVQHANKNKWNGEPRPFTVESVRHRQRDEEASCRPHEECDAHTEAIDMDRIGHPRVAAPGPPDKEKHERRTGEASRAQILEQKCRDLRDCEDEDEVEEELDVARPALDLGSHICVVARLARRHGAA